MKFRTVLDHTRDVDIWGLAENVEVTDVRFVIDWEVWVETREWGIKDFSPIVTNVAGEYDIETVDDSGDATSTETVEFDFEPYRENCTFAAELSPYRQLSVEHLEIELDKKSLEVS